MIDQWYYRMGDQVSGPFKWLEIVFLVNNQTITPRTALRNGETGRWVSASRVPGLVFRTKGRASLESSSGVSEQLNETKQNPFDFMTLVTGLRRAVLNAGLPTELFRPVSIAVVLGIAVLLLALIVQTRRPQSPIPMVASPAVENSQPSVNSDPSGGPVTAAQQDTASLVPAERVDTPSTNEPGQPDVAPPPQTGPKTASAEKSISDIVAECEPSVALIEGKSGSGTGFLVSPGLLATNRHVIENQFIESLKVSFPSAEASHQGPHQAELLYIDPAHDLALLTVKTTLTPIPLAKTSRVRKGLEVIAIGSPGAPTEEGMLVNAISRGIVSSHSKMRGHEHLQLDISINPGNSGGPVIGMDGGVLGVVTLRTVYEEGLAFCEPVDAVHDAIAASRIQSNDDIIGQRAHHRARVVYQKLAVAAVAYHKAMSFYVATIDRALERRENVGDAVRRAKEEVGQPLGRAYGRLFSELESGVEKVAVDNGLPAEMRQRFVDIWSNFTVLKSYVDNPRGAIDEFQKKSLRLFDNHDRQSESLRLLLGITNDE